MIIRRYLIDIGQSPRVIHDLKNVKGEIRKLCKIREIQKLNNDRYFPPEKDNRETVEQYVIDSPINGFNYVKCCFCFKD